MGTLRLESLSSEFQHCLLLPTRLPSPCEAVWRRWAGATGRLDCHLGPSGQEVAVGLLKGAQDRAAQGLHCGEALHVLVGQDGLPLLFTLGQCHIQWLGAHDTSIHLCHSLCRFFWRGKTHKAKSLAVVTLCHHLKARQDKGCWGWRRKLQGCAPLLPED